ncbi:MAG: DMT family transporter [Candidatus Roizmanbacteria bacterium]|nr:DMT family transporter [Candidatus Roizmanbacteria bacterium]
MKQTDLSLIPYLQLTAAMAIVGSSMVVGKIITSSFPVFLASGLSLGIASLIFVYLLIFSKYSIPKLNKKDLLVILLQAFLGTFIYRTLLLYGLRYTTAMQSGIITSTGPAVIGVLSYLLLREKVTKNKLIGIICSVLGVLIINLNTVSATSEQKAALLLGFSLVFGSVIVEALFSVLAKMVSTNVTPLVMAAFVTFFSFVMFLPFSVYEGLRFNYAQTNMADWVSIVYYGLFVTVISFQLWFRGLSKVDASAAGVFMGVVPVSSLILSYFILKEPFYLSYLAGAAFVILGISFIYKSHKYEPNK